MNPTDPDAYDWGDTSAEQIRAYLDHDKWVDSLTDEQREIRRKRLAILGSSDDTHSLNRYERGQR